MSEPGNRTARPTQKAHLKSRVGRVIGVREHEAPKQLHAEHAESEHNHEQQRQELESLRRCFHQQGWITR